MRIMNMSNPTLRNILESSPNVKLTHYPILKRALIMGNVLVHLTKNSTTTSVLEELEKFDPDALDKTIYELLSLKQPSKGVLHDCKSVAMWVMMIVISVAYAIVNIYISYITQTMVDWDTMFLTLVGPILVVLYERGVLSKENREILNVLSGSSPTLTFMEAINQRIANGPSKRSKRKQNENIEQTEITHQVDDY